MDPIVVTRTTQVFGGFRYHLAGRYFQRVVKKPELIARTEHLRQHMTEERKEISRKNLWKARAGAIRWHKSKAGRAWHSKHSRDILPSLLKTRHYVCGTCGKSFERKEFSQRPVGYCTDRCRWSAKGKSRAVPYTTSACPPFTSTPSPVLSPITATVPAASSA